LRAEPALIHGTILKFFPEKLRAIFRGSESKRGVGGGVPGPRKFSDSVDHGWHKPTAALDAKTSVEIIDGESHVVPAGNC